MHPTRRDILAAGLALPFASLVDARPEPAVTGAADPALKPFDDLLLEFLTTHKVPGAALAVTRQGKLVHARGYGLADLDKQTAVQPDALFRIASVSKPLTAVAVLKLVEAGKLGLDDKILDRVKLQPPPGKTLDPRWQKITLRMLLRHTGGWDRSKSGDPIGVPGEIARLFGQETPVPPALVIRYMMGRPLDFDPGTKYAYANVDYLLLGRAIEAASAVGYEAFVKKEVLAPLGIKTTQLGRALPENRAKNEVSYYDAKRQQRPCLYPPRRGQRVAIPDGAENFEAYEAHGGWIASAVDLVRFAGCFDDRTKCPLLGAKMIDAMWERPGGEPGHETDGKPKESYYGCGWNYRPDSGRAWHGGLISGTSTLLVRRGDGLCWAVLFNTDRNPDGKVLSGLIDGPLHEAADKVRRWPDRDLFGKYL